MHSFNPDLAGLLKQRQELEQAEETFKKHQQLIQERDLIDKNIIQLQEEIDHNFRQFHLKGQSDENLHHFQQILNEKQKELRQLRQTQSQLDAQLDHSDDLSQEELEKQQLQLLHNMWHLYPSLKEEQEKKWNKLGHLEILERELRAIENLLERLSEHLQLAIHTRKNIKGRALLNYIFGTSPNMIIERQLLSAHALIVKALPLLEQLRQQQVNETLYAFFEDLENELKKLKSSCSSTWGFHHIDTVFSSADQMIGQFLLRLKLEQDQFTKQINELKEEIQGWIQKL